MNTELQREITNKITERRNQLDMTITELRDKAGISKATFFRKMRGDISFTLEDIQHIADALQCTPEILLKPKD